MPPREPVHPLRNVAGIGPFRSSQCWRKFRSLLIQKSRTALRSSSLGARVKTIRNARSTCCSGDRPASLSTRLASAARPFAHQFVVHQHQRLRGADGRVSARAAFDACPENRRPRTSDSADCASRKRKRCGDSASAASFSGVHARYFDPLLIPCRDRREDAGAAHLRIQLAADQQHGIADHFAFQPPPVEAPQQLIVGIDFGRLGLITRTTADMCSRA